MSLTMGAGPLTAKDPHPANFAIDGPKHRIAWDVFPRRVRAEIGGLTIFDTRSGRLLHESQMLPVLYVPEADVQTAMLEPTESASECPFKGDASYWSVVAEGRLLAEDAAWGYPEPLEEADWLAGHYAFYWDKLDAWYDEDEEVRGHLRDPYHRVDARRSSFEFAVSHEGVEIARTERPTLLSETGLPNRVYVPREDVAIDGLAESEKRTHCPYKGDATYFGLAGGPADIAWSYEAPLEDAAPIAGHLCFDHDDLVIEGTPPGP